MSSHVRVAKTYRRCPCGLAGVIYPLDRTGYSRLRAACGRAHRLLLVVNLATPLAVTLRGRGGRQLDEAEKKRIRVMRSEGYHRRSFAHVTLPNAGRSARQTAQQIAVALGYRLTDFRQRFIAAT